MSSRELAAIVDFGGQYAQLIARRVRALGTYCELVPAHAGAAAVRALDPKAVILSGGPASVYETDAPALDPQLLDLGVPVLGICYGMQAIAQTLGGNVTAAPAGEFGVTTVHVEDEGALLAAVGAGEHPCLMSHRDAVSQAPAGFRVLASTASCPVAAMENLELGCYTVQFHPETVHTPFGDQLLRNFLFTVAGCDGGWSAASIVEQQVQRIRYQVGDAHAICGLSGGVDSAVAALLVHKALGDQLTCVFVDHGLLREGEAEQVVEAFRGQFDVPLVHVDASREFLSRLAGVTDPETKRRIIGEQFIRTFETQARELDDAQFLVQGTLYSDVIESGGSKNASTIKSHHNVGGLPADLKFELVEPLRLLFKDEVRAVGLQLGLPERFVWRQPFPGPGLAIRVIGAEITEERLAMLRSADRVLQEEIRAAGLYGQLWQSFCVLQAGVRSVGVQGDERTYGHPVVIRAVTSDDAMTAEWARLPYELLARVSSRIVNEVPGVNRVILDITAKPPGTIEWE